MLKLATIAVAVLVSAPALACDDEARPVRRYSYTAGYGYAPMSYASYGYDPGYYGDYYGYGAGLALAGGIARRAYWRNRWDNRPALRGGRGYVARRASFGGGRIGGIGRVGGGGRIGGRR